MSQWRSEAISQQTDSHKLVPTESLLYFLAWSLWPCYSSTSGNLLGP